MNFERGFHCASILIKCSRKFSPQIFCVEIPWMWCRTKVNKTWKAGNNLILYAGIFLVHLHLFHVQVFILQKDDKSSEQVINYQSYKKWLSLGAVSENIVLTDCSCRHNVWLQLPMHSDLKYLLLQVLEYMVLETTHSELLELTVCCMRVWHECCSLHILCICIVPW